MKQSVRNKLVLIMSLFSLLILLFSGLIVFKPELRLNVELYVLCTFCSICLIYYGNKLTKLY